MSPLDKSNGRDEAESDIMATATAIYNGEKRRRTKARRRRWKRQTNLATTTPTSFVPVTTVVTPFVSRSRPCLLGTGSEKRNEISSCERD
jgi:hypothetical protein